MDERSDKNLVIASHQGDKNAYALLVRRHYKNVFIACLGVSGNIEDAEDAAQEAMLKGFMQLDKLRNSSQFGPWIMKIARNQCINVIRRKQRSREIIADEGKRTAEIQSENEQLQQAIASLSLEIRQPLVMYYFDGQSIRTVANNLNISTSAVYSRLRCAIQELHRSLAEQGDKNG